jgi:HlyD family secretion protein
VWVLTETGVRRVAVQPGITDGTITAVTGDLPEGARVVTGVAATAGTTAARSSGSPLIPQRPARGGTGGGRAAQGGAR